ncbi:MAG: hypothetical protein R3299_10870, partial [Arenibacter sp.]|nr:hypothetical protein [Arenibacter sp.]
YALITRDFFRLKNLELGYNFNEDVIGRFGIQSLRVSVSGTNLITITDFPFDPEVTQNGVSVGSTRDASGGAVNNGGAYPMLKTIMTGLQITF